MCWYVLNNFNQLKWRYNHPCNFLTNVSQSSSFMFAYDNYICEVFELISLFTTFLPFHYTIHTQHDCSTQTNSNSMFSVAKLVRLLVVAKCQISAHLSGTTILGPIHGWNKNISRCYGNKCPMNIIIDAYHIYIRYKLIYLIYTIYRNREH